MNERLHPPLLPPKVDLGIIENYRSITFIAIAAKVYNPLLLNCIPPEIETSLENSLTIVKPKVGCKGGVLVDNSIFLESFILLTFGKGNSNFT